MALATSGPPSPMARQPWLPYRVWESDTMAMLPPLTIISRM